MKKSNKIKLEGFNKKKMRFPESKLTENFKELSKQEKKLPFVSRKLSDSSANYGWLIPYLYDLQIEQIGYLEKYLKYDEQQSELKKISDIEDSEQAKIYYRSLFNDKNKHVLNTFKKYSGFLGTKIELDQLLFSKETLLLKDKLINERNKYKKLGNSALLKYNVNLSSEEETQPIIEKKD